MAGCRDCKYFKTDVDLPYPVCTLHEFHFTTDYTPCDDFVSNAYKPSSSSSSSGSGKRVSGCIVAVVIAVVIGIAVVFFATNQGSVKQVDRIDEITQMEGETEVQPKTARVNSSNGLNLRKGPSTSDEKITAMPSNATVTVLETKDGWCRVRYNDKEGWCSADYLTIEG